MEGRQEVEYYRLDIWDSLRFRWKHYGPGTSRRLTEQMSYTPLVDIERNIAPRRKYGPLKMDDKHADSSISKLRSNMRS
jgi:hypothetical protein